MSRRGLPQAARMRHDVHYVEALAASSGSPIGRMVPIEEIDPNPDQPRQTMGDLSELIASIAEKGIIEPLVVRQLGSRYQIVAGERRYQAAVQVGLHEIPVVIRELDDGELIEIALIENIQRKNLTPFEEAEALRSLTDHFDYTHEQLARQLGKSRTSVTELLSLNSMPGEVKNLCRLADITSKSMLLHILRQGDARKMAAIVGRIARDGGLTRAEARKGAAKSKNTKSEPFVFKWAAPSKVFSVRMNFRRSRVNRGDLIDALEELLVELRKA